MCSNETSEAATGAFATSQGIHCSGIGISGLVATAKMKPRQWHCDGSKAARAGSENNDENGVLLFSIYSEHFD